MSKTFAPKLLSPSDRNRPGKQPGLPRGLSPRPGRISSGRVTPVDVTRCLAPSPFSPRYSNADRERISFITFAVDSDRFRKTLPSPQVLELSPPSWLASPKEALAVPLKLISPITSPKTGEGRFLSVGRPMERQPSYKSIQKRTGLEMPRKDDNYKKVKE